VRGEGGERDDEEVFYVNVADKKRMMERWKGGGGARKRCTQRVS